MPHGHGHRRPHGVTPCPPRLPCPKQHLGKHAEDLLVDVVDAASIHLVLELRPQGRVLLGGEEEGGGIAAPGQSGPAGQEMDRKRTVMWGRAEPPREQRGLRSEALQGGQGAPSFPTPSHPCSCVPCLQNPSQCPSLSESSQVSLRKLPAALSPLARLPSKVPEHRLGTTCFILCHLLLHLNESPWVAGTLPVRILHNVRHMGVSNQALPSLLLLPRNTSLPSSQGKPRDGSASSVLDPHN